MVKGSRRAKERTLRQITTKFVKLPPADPHKPILARMIVALRAELAPSKDQASNSTGRRQIDAPGAPAV